MAEKIKKPSKEELAEMKDFGEYISWLAKNNKKKDELYKKETKKLAGKKKENG